jgi:hypothetical protein
MTAAIPSSRDVMGAGSVEDMQDARQSEERRIIA